MKNPHGVEPTRFMKRKESGYAIRCYPYYGPAFSDGRGRGSDLHIYDNCNCNSNYIYNDGTGGYDCHSEYKSSLFVHTNDPDKLSYFIVSDYEVFTHY